MTARRFRGPDDPIGFKRGAEEVSADQTAACRRSEVFQVALD